MEKLKRKGASLALGPDNKKPKADGSIASYFGATSSPEAASAVKFDKATWVKALTVEQRKLLALEIQTLDNSWLAALKDHIVSKDFLELKQWLDQQTLAGKKWFPPKEDIYSWSRHTPFHNVRVVIVGQDPYHNNNQAHGLAFSVRPPTQAPPSLKNMYQELKANYPTFVEPPNKGGLLTPWADNGVLMLNTCLTVRAHEPSSHSNRGWERFTQKVIDVVAQKRPKGVVFIAWGVPAGRRLMKVDKQKHLVLRGAHPSPFSARTGFFGCGHFRKANEWLRERYGEEGEIDWALTPGTSTKSPAPVVNAGTSLNVKLAMANMTPSPSPSPPEQASIAPASQAKKFAAIDDDIDSADEAALGESLLLAEESDRGNQLG